MHLRASIETERAGVVASTIYYNAGDCRKANFIPFAETGLYMKNDTRFKNLNWHFSKIINLFILLN